MSRIYANSKEAISEIQRDLYEMGTVVQSLTMQDKDVRNDEGFKTKELQNYSFTILDDSDKDEIVTELDWCNAEFAERVSGWKNIEDYTPINPGEAHKLRDVWKEFIHNGKFAYSYNERMYWQLNKVMEELKKNPNTRQAIIEVHNRKIDQDKMGGKARIPCSMFYQFMIRNGKLEITYVMRSTDFFTHFKNDIWLACELKNWMAEQLEISPGKFTMFATSLHAYKKDFPVGVF